MKETLTKDLTICQILSLFWPSIITQPRTRSQLSLLGMTHVW